MIFDSTSANGHDGGRWWSSRHQEIKSDMRLGLLVSNGIYCSMANCRNTRFPQRGPILRWCVVLQLLFFSLSAKPCIGQAIVKESKKSKMDDTNLKRSDIQGRRLLESEHHSDLPRSLIVGGEVATPFRYPYIASLRYRGSHRCGGTLIAPDVFLTAAHCLEFFGEVQLGRHNFSNVDEDYESFVIQDSVSHPRHYPNEPEDLDAFDIALVHVYGQTKHGFRDVVQLDVGQNISKGQNLTTVGWGTTDADENVASDVLREGVVQYIPNEECRNIMGTLEGESNAFVNLQSFVIDVTLCARDLLNGTVDSCQGDSGGPLLLVQPDTPTNDVQVAIVSAGFDCAQPPFPAIYPRVAEVYDWIRANTCRLSLNPPEAFACPPVPTSAPTLNSGGDGLATLLIRIKFDLFPGELGWILQSENRETIQIRPILTFRDEPQLSSLNETIQVPNNQRFLFTILEGFGGKFGGLVTFDKGSVSVVLLETNATDGSTVETVLVHHEDKFFNSITYPIVLGVLPTMAPSQTPVPTMTMFPSSAPTETRPFISVVIDFDMFPSHTGYLLEAVTPSNDTISLLSAVYPGTFGPEQAGTRLVQQLPLLSLADAGSGVPQRFRFTMIDNEQDGFQFPGRYRVYFGVFEDNSNISEGFLLFEGGTFFIEDIHFFQIYNVNGNDGVAVVDGQELPSVMPSPIPITPNPTNRPTPLDAPSPTITEPQPTPSSSSTIAIITPCILAVCMGMVMVLIL